MARWTGLQTWDWSWYWAFPQCARRYDSMLNYTCSLYDRHFSMNLSFVYGNANLLLRALIAVEQCRRKFSCSLHEDQSGHTEQLNFSLINLCIYYFSNL